MENGDGKHARSNHASATSNADAMDVDEEEFDDMLDLETDSDEDGEERDTRAKRPKTGECVCFRICLIGWLDWN